MLFLGEGDMAIVLRFGLVMLSFGYHLYFEGNRIPECTVFWLNCPLTYNMTLPMGETSGLEDDAFDFLDLLPAPG